MKKLLGRLTRHKAGGLGSEDKTNKVKDRVVPVLAVVVIGCGIYALAKVPWLQLEAQPRQLPAAKTSSISPAGVVTRHVAAETVAVTPPRLCLDNPKRPPPCSGIGRR